MGLERKKTFLFKVTAQNTGLAQSPSRFSFFGGVGAITGLNPPNSYIDMYVATRTSEGWQTTYPGIPGSQVLGHGRPACSFSMSVCIDHRSDALVQNDPTDYAETAAYAYDVSGRSLGRWPTNFSSVPGAAHYVGDERLSGDFTHYVFSSLNLPFAPGGLTSAPGSVYDNDTQANSISIASKSASGADIARTAAAPMST